MKSKIIKVDYLARVEGEGALYIKIDGQRVSEVKLKIFEPPRFFEAFRADAGSAKPRTSPPASAASARSLIR